MLLNILQRVGYALLVIVMVTVGTTLLLSFAPGSVAEVILGEGATPENIATLKAQLGLDLPMWQQYLSWLGHAFQGDLGASPITHIPVMTAIMQRLPVTLEIAFLGLAIALVIAIILGVISAAMPGSAADRGINVLTSVFISVPPFVSGPLLIFIFAVGMHAFPSVGWAPPESGLGPNLRNAFLPALSVAFMEIASFQRVLRTDLVNTLREDYVAAARAKGMGKAYVMFRHAFRPSSFSLLTVAGINLARLIGGTIVVETLFGLPGLGQLVSNAIMQRDVITVQGVVTFIAVVFVIVNMLVDISYGLIDPRVRKAERTAKKKTTAASTIPGKAVKA